jgi:serine/threonine-protein kinase RsbW
MECEVKRDLSSLEQITSLLQEFFVVHKLPEAHRFSLAFAIEEIVTNIIRHQPKNRTSIQLQLNGTAERVVVTIVDPDSAFFDPTVAKDPPVDLPINQRKPGGLGIFLTKKMMDEVHYEFHDGTGITTLVKRLES